MSLFQTLGISLKSWFFCPEHIISLLRHRGCNKICKIYFLMICIHELFECAILEFTSKLRLLDGIMKDITHIIFLWFCEIKPEKVWQNQWNIFLCFSSVFVWWILIPLFCEKRYSREQFRKRSEEELKKSAAAVLMIALLLTRFMGLSRLTRLSLNFLDGK